MDTKYVPKHLRWEQTFAKKLFPVMANRHAIEGHNFERHSHDFMELVVVAGGTGRHLTQYGDDPLYVGRGLVLHPGVWHAYHDCDDLVIYNCCFRLELLQHEFSWGQADSALQTLLWPRSPFREKAALHRLDLTPEQVALCQNYLESIISLDKHQDAVKLRYMGLFLLFLATFVYPLQQENALQPQDALHPAVQQSMQLLTEHLATLWTLPELAHEVGLDPSYLVRLFRAQLDTTPMAYLNYKRVEQAASLLAHTKLPICEIGQQVGWLDANHFARRFRAQMGVSATRYREMCLHTTAQPDRTHDT